jgi:hypothetical protein
MIINIRTTYVRNPAYTSTFTNGGNVEVISDKYSVNRICTYIVLLLLLLLLLLLIIIIIIIIIIVIAV